MITNNNNQPFYGEAPIHFLKRLAMSKNMYPHEVVEKLGVNELEFREMFCKQGIVTRKMASRLKDVMGGTEQFWWNLALDYQLALRKQAQIMMLEAKRKAALRAEGKLPSIEEEQAMKEEEQKNSKKKKRNPKKK